MKPAALLRRGAAVTVCVAAGGALLGLAGCASLQPVEAVPAQAEAAFGGRLSVQVAAHGESPARSMTAAFELHGSPQAGRLDLSTPLGSLIGRARWAPGRVELQTPQGERRYANLDALTRDLLGESLPVDALFDWLRGRAWAGADSVPLPPPAAGFMQEGWAVDLARHADGLVTARRLQPPAVTVRAVLDRS